jgi:hypothetical protein
MKTSPSYKNMEASAIAERFLNCINSMIDTIVKNTNDYIIDYKTYENKELKINSIRQLCFTNYDNSLYFKLETGRSVAIFKIYITYFTTDIYNFKTILEKKLKLSLFPCSLKEEISKKELYAMTNFVQNFSQRTRKRLLKGIVRFEKTGDKWALRSLWKWLGDYPVNLEFNFYHNDKFNTISLSVKVKEEVDMINKCKGIEAKERITIKEIKQPVPVLHEPVKNKSFLSRIFSK